jgi:diacylglycerol kinase family enzyme
MGQVIMMKMLFVFNPNSGKAQIKNQLMKIIQVFSKAGYEITVYPTKASLDGYQHILDNEGRYDVITCSGGDGTLNETVAAVLKYKGEKPPIGYIPSGTTNDFAASLGIPRNMVKAAVNIAKGKRFPCDVGMVNGERSFNYVGRLQGSLMELHRILRMYWDIRLM